MSKQDKEQVAKKVPDYQVQESTVDGRLVKTIVNSQGHFLFAVGEDYTDEHIDLIYQTADRFFKAGVNFGVASLQRDLKTLLGVPAEAVDKE